MQDHLSHHLVKRLIGIFGSPTRPSTVTESQFDGYQEELEKLRRAPWGLTSEHEFSYYLDDLAYEKLQPDLFQYLFPSLLITWWQGLAHRRSQAWQRGTTP